MGRRSGRTLIGGVSAPGRDDLERRDMLLGGPSALLSLTEMAWQPPYVPRDITHCHNYLEIGMCVEGRGRLMLDGAQAEEPFGPGTITVIPAGVYHCQINEGERVTRWRYISADALRLMEESPAAIRALVEPFLGALGARAACFAPGGRAADAWEIIAAMYAGEREGEDALPEQEARLLLLLCALARTNEGGCQRRESAARTLEPVQSALAYIAAHYEGEVRVAQLARACAMSESHFRRTFAQTMGVSPLEYLNRYRIQRARELLAAGRKPIQNVAMECGFVSMATFNRNFTRFVGLSPSDWRQNRVNMTNEMESDLNKTNN